MQAPHTPKTLREQGWKSRTLPGFTGLVGPLWTRKEDSGWAYGLLATADHLNPVALVHGGLLSTLIDHALSAMAWEAVGRRACVTVQLDTQFLSAAREGQFLEARGRVVRATSSLVFMQGQVTVAAAGERTEVVSASAILKLIEPARQAQARDSGAA